MEIYDDLVLFNKIKDQIWNNIEWILHSSGLVCYCLLTNMHTDIRKQNSLS